MKIIIKDIYACDEAGTMVGTGYYLGGKRLIGRYQLAKKEIYNFNP